MNLKYIKLLRKYSKYSHPKVYDWNWELKGYNRIALVNYLISVSGGHNCNYLEIGCASNDLFDSVFTSKKTGVDPYPTKKITGLPPGVIKMSFFLSVIFKKPLSK